MKKTFAGGKRRILPAALLLAVLLTGCTGKIEHIEPNSVE